MNSNNSLLRHIISLIKCFGADYILPASLEGTSVSGALVSNYMVRNELLSNGTGFAGVPVGPIVPANVHPLVSSGLARIINNRLHYTNRVALKAASQDAGDELTMAFKGYLKSAKKKSESQDYVAPDSWDSVNVQIVERVINSVSSEKQISDIINSDSDVLVNPLSLNDRIQGNVVNSAPFRPGFDKNSEESKSYRTLVNGFRTMAKTMVCAFNMGNSFQYDLQINSLKAVFFEGTFHLVMRAYLVMKQLVVVSSEDPVFTLNRGDFLKYISGSQDELRITHPELFDEDRDHISDLNRFFQICRSGYKACNFEADDAMENPIFNLFIRELQRLSKEKFPQLVVDCASVEYWENGSFNSILSVAAPTQFPAFREGANKAVTTFVNVSDINKDLTIPLRLQSEITAYLFESRQIDQTCTSKLQDLNSSFKGLKSDIAFYRKRRNILDNWRKKRSEHDLIVIQLLADPLLWFDEDLTNEMIAKLFGNTGTRSVPSNVRRKKMRQKGLEMTLESRQEIVNLIAKQLEKPTCVGIGSEATYRVTTLRDIDYSKVGVDSYIIDGARKKRDSLTP